MIYRLVDRLTAAIFFHNPVNVLPLQGLLRKVHGRLNASWKISCLAVNGQSFLVIDGYLLNPVDHWLPVNAFDAVDREE